MLIIGSVSLLGSATAVILAMAEHDGMPAGSALRQVAELENVIAAVEAVAAEEADRARRGGQP
jgi:hypothetical protein